MKKTRIVLAMLCGSLLFVASCKKDKKDKDLSGVEVHPDEAIPLDSTAVAPFFKKYPDYKEFEPDIKALYKKHDYKYIWEDKDGPIEFADVLYNRVNQMDADGLPTDIPYKEKINDIFYGDSGNKADTDDELLISAMYFYFTKKVYQGLDADEIKQTGWYLPREKVDYVSYLDTLMQDPNLIREDKKEFFNQYYNLKKGLEKYRQIEKNGGWGTIDMDKSVKSLKPGDSSATVAQVRKRLYLEGYLKNDNGNAVFDDQLIAGIGGYEGRHNQENDSLITPDLVKDLNIPVSERIKTISVNMERCRWVPAKLNNAEEFIAVNIPSYWLQYMRNGKEVLHSRVVVGKVLHETVVFSGEMSYIVFSPYWNVPPSILKNEIQPGIAKDANYLAKHNMEWVDDRVRQKPGPDNALGLVKFMFPNSNNIYLHDTPSKSLFSRDERAFSHGCVRVQKAHDLAVAITKEDGNWTESKVDKAMHSDSQSVYNLKKKIPVYIAYFTAWADKDGNVVFFDDVYNRDDRLANMLYKS